MSTTPIADPSYDECLWPIDPACKTDEWNALPEADKERGLALASATLRRLTGYRVGGCPLVVRPCKKSCAMDYGYYDPTGGTFVPHISTQGQWVNACGCTSDCSCGPLCEVRLPLPIGEIISVDVAGVDVTAQTRILNNRLVWTGAGECPFPTCQDLSAAPGAPDTFTVTYRQGAPVDGLGAYAVGVLALEYAKACTGSKNCRLPRGTTQVVRQGVTIEVVTGSFPNGMTGIQEVDSFIALWRPEGAPRWPSRVWTPGMASRVQR